MPKYVAVTGCAGFIGRVVTQKLLERGDFVYGVDALTYAADPDYNARLIDEYAGRREHRYSFVVSDIRQLGRWPDVDAIIHLAASTHVDNSLHEGADFVGNNVDGTAHLLEMTRAKSQHGMPHFIHISTDEVYGSVDEGQVTEDAPLRPTSPYAASKAAADLLVQAWWRTYGVPHAIIRPTNCYGTSGQYPEKLIPKTVRSLMLGRPVPIHGDGSQTRCWLKVEDLVAAILLVLDKRLCGVWNVGGNAEVSVREVVVAINEHFYKSEQYISPGMETGFTRPACDQRYAVDDSKLRAAGWKPEGDFYRDLGGLVEQERLRFRF